MRSVLTPPRSHAAELIDEGGHDPALLAENLADMQRANRWLGGVQLAVRALRRLAADTHPGDTLRILDVATGSGDVPRALVAWAAGRGVRVEFVATDLSAEIVAVAARDATPRLVFAAADGCALPFTDGSFDVAMCSFALHHLAPNAAVAMLREMRRVSRRGVVVDDLVRWRPFYWATWLACHASSANPLTRHDGPLSVLRAYTRTELAALVAASGAPPPHFETFLGYRVAMTLAPRT